MRIIELKIEGFRSLRDVTWQPGDLNVVIGPNASGKSNLLRFLQMVSASAKGKLADYVTGEGGMEPLVWDGASEVVQCRLRTTPAEEGKDVDRESLTYELSLQRLGKGSTYRVEHELLGNYYKVTRGWESQPFKLIEREGRRAHIFDESERSLVAPEEAISEEETLLSVASGPFTQNRHIPAYQAGLAAWSVYHDVHVNRSAAIRQSQVSRYERSVAPDGQNLVNVLHTLYTGDREFKDDLNAAMTAAFGEDFDELVFPPAADQRVQLRVRWKSLHTEQPAADLSDGTLRYLFLIATLASPALPPVIAIDEPETGLHPSMLPIIADYAVDASRRAQVILTTHSPQLLDAFEDVKPTVTVAKWADGETTLNTLDDEALRYWLKDYTLGKLYRTGELEAMR